MSVARPARGLFGRCLSSTRTAPAAPIHAFHTSSPCSQRRSRFRNVTAEEMGLLKGDNMAKYQRENFPSYTKDDLAALERKYSPEQLEAIRAGEKAVDTRDIILQGRLRDDQHRPDYVEDYTVLDPRYDLKPQTRGTPIEPQFLNSNDWVDDFGVRLAGLMDKKTDHLLIRGMTRALQRVKQSTGEDMIDLTDDELNDIMKDPELINKYLVREDDDSEGQVLSVAQAQKFDEAIEAEWLKELNQIAELSENPEAEPSSLELVEDGPAGSIRADSAEAAELGKVPGVAGLYKLEINPEDEGDDSNGQNQELRRLTGMSLSEIQSIVKKVLVTRFVSNQTRLGKVRSYSVLAIAGNGNGRLGLGIGRSTTMNIASQTATMLAVRNMKPIRRYENRTIFGNVSAKISGSVVELSARPAGFGLRCPHRIFEMCRACGIHDLAAKMPRSKNPLNTVKAAYAALTNQPDPEEIAIGRGKKMVDVRKVYYGGAVH